MYYLCAIKIQKYGYFTKYKESCKDTRFIFKGFGDEIKCHSRIIIYHHP